MVQLDCFHSLHFGTIQSLFTLLLVEDAIQPHSDLTLGLQTLELGQRRVNLSFQDSIFCVPAGNFATRGLKTAEPFTHSLLTFEL